MNYYNEFDPKAAAWLRELIHAGHIPKGEVDERSILEVRPKDLRGFIQCHFFAGIGGWPYAFRLAGWSESEPIWSASCPCQPLSCAGQQKGHADERHLWPAFYELVAQRRPATIVGEQVASKLGREWFAGIRADLEGVGYAVGGSDLCSPGVGSPNIRQRIYWMAHAGHEQTGRGARPGKAKGGRPLRDASGLRDAGGLANPEGRGLRIDGSAPGQPGHPNERSETERMAHPVGERRCSRELGCEDASDAGKPSEVSPWSNYDLLHMLDGKTRRIEPGSFPLASRVPARVVRLRGYGNAINPWLAARFIQSCVEVISEDCV